MGVLSSSNANPRFDPPSDDTRAAVAGLLRLSDGTSSSSLDLDERRLQAAVDDLDAVEMLQQVRRLRKELVEGGWQCVKCLMFGEHFGQARAALSLAAERDRLRHYLSADALRLKPEYDCKLRVLKSLGFVDDSDLVQLKGRVACELSTQELLLTQLLLENRLKDLDVPDTCAMLSCFTCQHRNSQVPLSERMQELRNTIVSVAERLDETQQRCGVTDREQLIANALQFDLMDVVRFWAAGQPFARIMKETDAHEGIIVRCIQRLDELCRDVRNAARVIGEPALADRMHEASAAVRRDIVFAASLYTVD